MKTSLVITTINNVNKNIKLLAKNSKKNKWQFIVVGDKKTPKGFNISYGQYFNLSKQKKLQFNFSKKCPINNYARKNIGYLISIKNKSDVIVETDDDNCPKENFFKNKKLKHSALEIKNKSWVNIYNLFVKKNYLWPRGLPLDFINNRIILKKNCVKKYYLQQGICEGNPDVDAIYRLLNKKINIKFRNNFKIGLGSALSPFNSQNTVWFKEIFPLLYLPVTCSMRCTDIWRSLIALAILRNDKKKLLFFGTTMSQKRNFHNLLKDFEQEIPMYLYNKKIFNLISKLNFKKGIKNYPLNLRLAYKSLIKNNFISKSELLFLEAWITDLKTLKKN